MVTATQLNQRINQIIREICPNEFTTADHQSHCAHYVSHVLNFHFGTTCKMQKDKGFPGACIRVDELFAHCPQVGLWVDRPAHVSQCLIFVTDRSNVDLTRKSMTRALYKHVGIYVDGRVWAYGRISHVQSYTVDEFHKTYKGSGIEIYYGTMPRS